MIARVATMGHLQTSNLIGYGVCGAGRLSGSLGGSKLNHHVKKFF
jgi:hypothetical protein